MGKATEPPKCKACGKQHWGTCMDHENRGYLSARAEPAPAPAAVRAQRIAKAEEVIASTKPKRSKPKKAAPKKSGRRTPVPDAGAAATPPAAAPPQQADETAAPEPKRRGRPKTVDDRKAYLALKARERRARSKPTI